MRSIYYENKQNKFEVALKGINFILENISPIPEVKFENDPILQRATVLTLIIIGEETKKINNDV